MRSSILALVLAAAPVASAQNSSLAPHDTGAVTIHAAMLIDGRGHMERDALVTVRRGRIERVESGVGSRGRGATYELGEFHPLAEHMKQCVTVWSFAPYLDD